MRIPFSITGHEEGVLAAGLLKLMSLRGVHGLRISMPPDRYERMVIDQMQSATPIDVSWRTVRNHSILKFPATYEKFLATLGNRTRRNFRYYRRRFESTGNVYEEALPFSEFTRVAQDLRQRRVIGATQSGLARALGVLQAVESPILTGLRTSSGTWLSVLGGWYASSNPVVFMQMNNERDWPDDSLALVLRSYLIEQAIANGASGMIFWAGVGGPLGRYAVPLPTIAAYVDRASAVWRLIRRVTSSLSVCLPPSRFPSLTWVAPPSEIEPGR